MRTVNLLPRPRQFPYADCQAMKTLFIWHSAADPHNRILFDEMIRRPNVDVLVLTLPRVDDRLTMWHFRRPVGARNRAAGSRYRIVPGRAVRPDSLGHHFYLDLPRHLREFLPDVIHVVAEAASLVAVECAALRPLFSPRSRLVLHVIQNILLDYRWPWPLLERYAFSRADAAVAYSPGAAAVLRKRRFRKPVFVRPFGQDDRAFRARAGSGRRIRARLKSRAPVVGWAGRMFAGKGLHVLLEASRLMRRPHQLLVVGDGPLAARERDRVRRLGLEERTNWLGPVPIARMPEHYAAMDVYTHPAISRPPDMPAWKEQFARTLSEAMLAGVPVVSTKSGEIPWVLGNCGVTVPERNPRALAKALDRLVASKSLRRSIGRRGQARALANFTWSRAADELMDIWHRVSSMKSEVSG